MLKIFILATVCFAVLAMPALAPYIVQNQSYNVLALPFDENTGNIAHDRSIFNSVFYNYSLPMSWVSGVYDTGQSFDGSQASNSSYNEHLNSSTFTVTAWIKTSDLGVFFDRGNAACGSAGFQFAVTTGGIAHKITAHGGSLSWISGNSNIDDGKWHFVAFSYNGTHAQFYLNDSATTLASDGIVSYGDIFDETDTNIWLGKCGDTNNPFTGSLDEIQQWNTSLSLADIQIIMKNSIFIIIYPTSTSLTLNGASGDQIIGNGSAITISATSNVSLPVTIYANGAEIAAGTGSASNVSAWPEGLFNITAVTSGNATFTGSTAQAWLTTTYTPPVTPPATTDTSYMGILFGFFATLFGPLLWLTAAIMVVLFLYLSLRKGGWKK